MAKLSSLFILLACSVAWSFLLEFAETPKENRQQNSDSEKKPNNLCEENEQNRLFESTRRSCLVNLTNKIIEVGPL